MTYSENEAFEGGAAAGCVVTGIAAVIVAILSGHPIWIVGFVGIASAGVTIWYSYERHGGFPFTARARMGASYSRERDRRAADFVKLGIEPEAALARAVKDMAKEAEDVLREEGK